MNLLHLEEAWSVVHRVEVYGINGVEWRLDARQADIKMQSSAEAV